MTIFITSIIFYLIYITLVSTKSLQMLQQNRYNRGYKYVKWLIKNYKECFINYTLILLIYILLYFSDTLQSYVGYITIIIYSFLSYVFISNRKKENTKIPLKYTARIKRLIATNSIIHILIALIITLNYSEEKLVTYYLVLALIAYFN